MYKTFLFDNNPVKTNELQNFCDRGFILRNWAVYPGNFACQSSMPPVKLVTLVKPEASNI
jgi:hypothetical protein